MPIRSYRGHFSIFHSFHDEAQFNGIAQVLTPDLSHTHITLIACDTLSSHKLFGSLNKFSFTSGSSEALCLWLFRSPFLDFCFLLPSFLQLSPAKTQCLALGALASRKPCPG